MTNSAKPRECWPFFLALLCLLAPLLGYADVPGERWDRIDPAAAGWSVERLERARSIAEQGGASTLLVVQDGRIVFDWGRVSDKIFVHSVRKSLMNALYGIAVAASEIDPNSTLAQLGIDDAPTVLTSGEKAATVRDLLRSRSGVYIEAAGETARMKDTRPQRFSHPPGSFYYYNNWDFNVLGAILERRTGQSVFAAFAARIARPIGMEHFSERDGWYKRATSSRFPAYHMAMTAPDLARFGLLYLNRGRWGDRVLIPADWIRDSLVPRSEVKPGLAFGQLWWVATRSWLDGAPVGDGAFAAMGAGGQYLMIMPAHRMVLVYLSDTEDADERRISATDFGRLLKTVIEAQPGVRGSGG